MRKPPEIIWFCAQCKEENRPFKNIYNPINGSGICPIHGTSLKEIDINIDEYLTITKISKDISFLEAMIKLKQDDIIEYQSRMLQFRNQVEQQKQLKKSEEESSKPHCPTCGSTNIKKISGLSKVGSVAMWGILSRKVHKQWHCNNCSSEW